MRIATVTRLEGRHSARTAVDLRAGLRQPPVSAMPVQYLTPAIEDRAVESWPCWGIGLLVAATIRDQVT